MIYNMEGDKLINVVTPEMYGAIGDGITDDTAAWQAAVNSGFNVVATSAAYRCGTINVTENIEIDCNNATFTCTADKLFNCTGTVTNTVQNAGNYVAYKNFAGRSGYTGLAMLTSTDNVITLRTYYYGGFVARFEDGVCYDNRPVGFTGVTIDEFDPITCVVRNIGTVTHPNNPDLNYTIHCTYGHNCLFENITNNGEKYSIVTLRKCLGCEIKFVNGYCTYTGSYEYYYPLAMLDSSECLTHHCDIASDWWHCWTTGGNYFCYGNVVEWCNFRTVSGGVALQDHNNAIGTIVRNCELNSCGLAGGGQIYDSKIHTGYESKTNQTAYCAILLGATNLQGINDYIVDNIEFVLNPDLYSSNSGVYITVGGQVDNCDFYVEDVIVRDIRATDESLIGYLKAMSYGPRSSAAASLTFNGVITLDNVTGVVTPNNPDSIITYGTKSRFIVQNCHQKDSHGLYWGSNAATLMPPYVEINDSDIYIRGTFDYLRMSNVRRIKGLSSIGYVNGGTLLEATNIDYISDSYIQTFTNARIMNMIHRNNNFYVYAIVDPTIGNIRGLLSANGIVNSALE